MANVAQKHIDWFKHKTNMHEDIALKYIKAKYKAEGYGIWCLLLEAIYGQEGYYMKFGKKEQWVIATELAIDRERLVEIVADLVDNDLFDKKLFEEYQILSSAKIQYGYLEGSRKKSVVNLKSEYIALKNLINSIEEAGINIKCRVCVDGKEIDRTNNSNYNEPETTIGKDNSNYNDHNSNYNGDNSNENDSTKEEVGFPTGDKSDNDTDQQAQFVEFSESIDMTKENKSEDTLFEDDNSNYIDHNSNYNGDNSNYKDTDEMREDKRREDEIRKDKRRKEKKNINLSTETAIINLEYHELNSWIKEHCPEVSKMKTQMTAEECDKILQKFSGKKVAEVLNAMDNHNGLQKKYISVYKTLLSWLKIREENNHNNRSSSTGYNQYRRPMKGEPDPELLLEIQRAKGNLFKGEINDTTFN